MSSSTQSSSEDDSDVDSVEDSQYSDVNKTSDRIKKCVPVRRWSKDEVGLCSSALSMIGLLFRLFGRKRRNNVLGMVCLIFQDKLLKRLVETHGVENWNVIADHFPNRTELQCQYRWQRIFNPNLVKGPWTKEVGYNNLDDFMYYV